MIKAIAIDDEPLALQILEALCARIAYIDLLKTFTSQTEAQRYINKFEVDLLFLDIQMPRQNGIDLYKSLKQETKVIFTTAYSEYAVVKRELDLEQNKTTVNTHLSIRADYKLYNIPHNEIIFIEAMDDYIKINRENKGTVVARSTMKGILKKLPQDAFTRIHKSFIVNNSKVEAIQTGSIELAGRAFPIGSTYKDQVHKNF